MQELIPFPLAVGDLGTRLALIILFFVAICVALRSRAGGFAADTLGSLLCIYLKLMHEVQPADIDRFTRNPQLDKK